MTYNMYASQSSFSAGFIIHRYLVVMAIVIDLLLLFKSDLWHTYIHTCRQRDRQTDRQVIPIFFFPFFSLSLLSCICCSHIIFCLASCSLRSCLHDCSCSKSLCSTSSLFNQSDWFDENSAFNSDIPYQ